MKKIISLLILLFVLISPVYAIDEVEIPNSTDFAFGTGNFTIEGWFYLDHYDGANRNTFTIISKDGYAGDYNYTNLSWTIYIYENSTGTTGYLSCDWAYPGSPYSKTSMSLVGIPVTTGQWHHFAFLRNGSDLRLFLDGYQDGTNGDGTLTDSINTTTYDLYISNISGPLAGTWPFYGWVDEVRISNTDRYGLSDFTPPTSAFVSDANTLLLLHADGANGATTTIDSSSYARTITMSGATSELSTGRKQFGLSGFNLNVTLPPAPGGSYKLFFSE